MTSPASAETVGGLDAPGPIGVDDELRRHPAGSAGEQHDAVGQAGGLPHVVGDEQDRGPGLPPDPLELVVQDVAGHGVERAEGLVHEQHVGVLGQRPGQGHPLAHATGQLVGLLVDEPLEAHQLEQLEDPGLALLAGDAAQAQRQLHVLAHREPREQRRLLEHEGGLPGAHHLSRGGVLQAGDEVEQGGLAAARRADQADELAGADLQRDPVEGEDRGVRRCRTAW